MESPERQTKMTRVRSSLDLARGNLNSARSNSDWSTVLWVEQALGDLLEELDPSEELDTGDTRMTDSGYRAFITVMVILAVVVIALCGMMTIIMLNTDVEGALHLMQAIA